VSADGRSVETQGISAAQWTLDVGPRQRGGGRPSQQHAHVTYGQQEVVTTYETRLPVRRLYLAEEIGPVSGRSSRREASNTGRRPPARTGLPL
jgi:hypothetical protein